MLPHPINQTRSRFPVYCYGCLLRCDSSPPLCPQCLTMLPFSTSCHLPTRQLDHLYYVFDYLSPINQWIKQYKFQDQRHYAIVFAHFISDALNRITDLTDYVIIPVPLHPERLRQRGFNQCHLIAQHLSLHTSARITYDLLIKRKTTAPQAKLSGEKRKKNIHGAFRITNKLPRKPIVILDDVITTGSTVEEMARTLRQHGATDIIAVCVASTPRTALSTH